MSVHLKCLMTIYLSLLSQYQRHLRSGEFLSVLVSGETHGGVVFCWLALSTCLRHPSLRLPCCILLGLRSAELDVFPNENTFVVRGATVPLSWRRSVDICRPIASVCHLPASRREATGDKSSLFLVFSPILELDIKIPIAPTALRS